MAKTVLVTGANRGLGLDFVREYLKVANPPKVLIATYREESTADDLKAVAAANPNVHPLQLDISKFDSFPDFESKVSNLVGDYGLDVLVNNAGCYFKVALEEGSAEDMLENYKINVVSPLMLTRALLPLLKKATAKNSIYRPLIANVTSKMGSISDNTSGSHYAYRASKSALNQVTVSMSVDLEKTGVKAVAIHPGWVRTRMGGPQGLIDSTESCSNMVRVIGEVQSGKNKDLFLNYDGKKIDW